MTLTSRRKARNGAPPGAVISRNDRFSILAVVILVAVSIIVGQLLRQRASNAQWLYSSLETGIEATYPAGWLVDESGDYVARIRDPKARPFKTRYTITIVPGGGQTSVRNVIDGLTLQRSSDLSAYRVLNVVDLDSETTTTTQMDFVFVEADPNPFIQRLPVVVLGRDIVIRDGNRIIVVTLMAEESAFAESLPDYVRFIASLRY